MQGVNKFLDESEAIENLSAEHIKDIYVRKQLWSGIRKSLMNKHRSLGNNVFETEEYERIMEQLKVSGKRPIGHFAHDKLAFEFMNEYKESDKEFIDFYWSKQTKDELDESEKVEMAREHLKRSVNGSCGMPQTELIRDGLKKWKEIEEQ